MPFRAPTRDLLFTLTEIVGVEQLAGVGPFAEFDMDTVSAILEAAGQLASDVLAPLNQSGDREGAHYENGRVSAPKGFAEAYKAFAEGGWGSLSADPAFGGQGLPKVLELAVFEMVDAANMAFGLCPMLSAGAVEALRLHGDERQKRLYLPRLISGEWTGVMDLTEPQAGSDLGVLTTRAEPDGNGGYRLTGQKIFITWGEHDLTDNIVHMVLARIDGAPEGSRGISLFLAPRRLVGEDGGLGEANALRCGGIEHKLGINASPTCTILFEGAKAELVGEANHGLPLMFTMMNAARLNVGVEGVAIAERAYQQALAYALERRQGRAEWAGGDGAAPIFDHPDVRRMLADMRARIEAARAICLLTAVCVDLAASAPEQEAREAADLRQALLTPIAKAWCTDMGVEAASLGVQIHGGMGFIEETGAAQHYRDARIAPIYEGTNGIQAIDLVGRKLAMADGAPFAALIKDMKATAEILADHRDQRLCGIGTRLDAAVAATASAATWLLDRRNDPDGLAGATPFLRLMGDTIGGWLLAKGAVASCTRSEADLYAGARIHIAAHYAESILAQAPGKVASVIAGAAGLKALDEAALS